MVKTALEETRFMWWRMMLLACMRIYDKTGRRYFLINGARYASRIEGWSALKEMDEEENDGDQ